MSKFPTQVPQIDPEFKALIPPLADEELAQLEVNIKEDGCRDALVVWVETGILLDGHHRFEICQRNKLPFDVKEISRPDRDSAKDWIDCNSMARRNLKSDQVHVLRGRVYNRDKKREGGSGSNQYKQLGNIDPVARTSARIAKQFGVSEKTIRRDAKLAEEVEKTPELAEAFKAGTPFKEVKRKLKEKKRAARRKKNAKKIESVPAVDLAVSDVRFSTIVIDPPWDWGDEGDVDQMGRAKPDYATLSFDELLALPVEKMADEDCHLYLWITNRSLPKGFDLIQRWGFRYVTCITWVKPSYGMGNYFRGQTEHVLFGVRGSQPLKRKDVGTVFSAPRGKGHSGKPEEFSELVESCSPGPFLEMFSRRERPGWKSWGEGSA